MADGLVDCGDMEASWFQGHWFELLQTVGIIGSLLLGAYAIRSDDKARRIQNLLAVHEQHGRIWREFSERPGLSRVLKSDVDLQKQPISDEELLFVKRLILHLGTVHRAMREGLFIKIEGLREDTRRFFAAPIPKVVWEKIKPFQDEDFVVFIEDVCRG